MAGRQVEELYAGNVERCEGVVQGSEVMGWSAPIPTGAHYIQASAEGDRHEKAH